MAKKFKIEAYDTTANKVMPDQEFDKLSELKPKLQALLDAETHNCVLIKQDGVAIAQYLLNRKKDKWRKTLG